MHVQRHVVAGGRLGQPFQRVIAAPVQIGRRQLDPGPRLARMLLAERVEHLEELVERHGLGGEMLGHRRLQLRREAAHELGVVLVDQPVLVTDREGVGHAHADGLVGPQHLVGAVQQGRQPAGDPAVQVLDRGDPGLDHLERRVEGVEIGIDPPRAEPTGEPQLERIVGRAQLQRGQTDMVVAIDEARQDHPAGIAHDLGLRVAPRQLRERTGGPDHPVLLIDGTVLDDLHRMAIAHPGHDMTSTDQRAGFHQALGWLGGQASARASCSAKARSTSSRSSSVNCRRNSK